ncbi:MAG: 16S rRNA (guanine(966)-N(2))-methyltransferase RsmD [Betaproteobacteria bacterium]|nr:16S rRNA (guanine(966)-N(2))-methyltransferase RsmD [Betaproteobacteria bacterium]MBI2959843.1 16S rRNA (guanine(966)-N(2))-methyltransferase RsmD [Betaproteobacteria bacterium]
MRRKSSTLRIIGGTWRSRVIRFAASADLRATPDRVRETLFDWLGQDLSGRACLDLFAGSGALGFEALSRGASRVVMVEKDRETCRVLEENAARLGARGLTIQCADAIEFLARASERFDVIFLDPPYRSGVAIELWARLPGCLAEGGLVYVESGTRFAAVHPFALIRASRAGNVHFHLIGRSEQ